MAAGSAPTCATQLHCSRTTAGAHAKLDYHGIVGLVCMHIIPLLGLFLAMPTYEQHYYYDVLFESVGYSWHAACRVGTCCECIEIRFVAHCPGRGSCAGMAK